MAVPEPPPPDARNTLAAVVTHHPDDRLERNVEAILPQVSLVLIVDNASGPGSARHLAAAVAVDPARVRRIDNADNAGLGAAYNQAFRTARERGLAWVLLFDQDSRVREGFVDGFAQALRAGPPPRRGPIAVLGAVYDEDGLGGFPLDGGRPRGDLLRVEARTAISSGSAIAVDAWAALGPFREDLFIDFVDDEYCLRARRAGRSVCIAPRAVMWHEIGRGTVRRFLWRTVRPMNQSATRWYFVARNFLLVASEYALAEPGWLAAASDALVRRALKMTFYEDGRLGKWGAILRGAGAAIVHRRPAPTPGA